MATTMKGIIGGGTTFSAKSARLKPYFEVIGGSPYYSEYWDDRNLVEKVSTTDSGVTTVHLKESPTTLINLCSDCSGLIAFKATNLSFYHVEDMSHMFYSCYNITDINFEGFEAPNIKYADSMFGGCERLTSIKGLNYLFRNTSKLKSTNYMFYFCPLDTIDLSNIDTSNVENMAGMFSLCRSLTTIRGILDMKSCTEYTDMFDSCISLSGVRIKNPPSGFDGAGLSSSQYTIVS